MMNDAKLQLLAARKINQRNLLLHGKKATKEADRQINLIVAKILKSKPKAQPSTAQPTLFEVEHA